MPKRIPWGKLHPLLCQLCLYLPALAMGRFVDWTSMERKPSLKMQKNLCCCTTSWNRDRSRMVGSGAAQKLMLERFGNSAEFVSFPGPLWNFFCWSLVTFVSICILVSQLRFELVAPNHYIASFMVLLYIIRLAKLRTLWKW